ncbi:MAG: hypothetical protein R3B13_19265 [Polyangiaceae bacterium]
MNSRQIGSTLRVATLSVAVVFVACGGKGTGGNAGPDGGGSGGTAAGGGTGAVGAGGSSLGGYAGVGLGGSGGTGLVGTIDPSQPGTQPPAPAGGGIGTGTTPTVLAIRRVRLGEIDPSGAPNPNAWASMGYNLDGLISTKTGTNHCKRQPNTSPTNQEDGNGGIDNSFGKNILPILKTFVPVPSGEAAAALEQGGETILLKLDNLDAATNQTGINASAYQASALTGLPSWNGSDVRSVTSDSVNGGNVSDAKVKFPSSYVANGVWVSGGAGGTLTLLLSVGGTPLPLPISRVLITMNVHGPGAAATQGMIVGVIQTEALVAEFEKVAGTLTAGQLCPGNPTLEGALVSVRQASDIMADGSNGDPNQTCDAISVAIGFETGPVQLGGLAPPVAPPPDPCAN